MLYNISIDRATRVPNLASLAPYANDDRQRTKKPLRTQITELPNLQPLTNLEIIQKFRPSREQGHRRNIPQIHKIVSYNEYCNTSGKRQTVEYSVCWYGNDASDDTVVPPGNIVAQFVMTYQGTLSSQSD